MTPHKVVCLLSLIGCQVYSDTASPDQIILSRDRSLVTDLVLPWNNRPGDGDIPDHWSFTDEFEPVRTIDGIDEYSHPMPANVLFYGATNRRSPPDMTLTTESGQRWDYESRTTEIGSVGTWSYSRGNIFVRVSEKESVPDFQIAFPLARTSEQRLNFIHADSDPMDFTLNPVQGQLAWREGLYLPAPAHIEYAVTVPENGHLSFRAQLLPPPIISSIESDGANIVIEGNNAGMRLEFERILLLPGSSTLVNIDLSQYEGQNINLRFRTEAREDSNLDYVLLGEPTLYTPRSDPRRVLLVFIDTLRPDRMGIYGHERSTTPVMDAIGRTGVVFEQARAPSSWTLPSGRSSISGMQPDNWQQTEHLGTIFGTSGV